MNKLLTAALVGLVAGAATNANAEHKMGHAPKGKEKCYGVAKAGKNDCSWAGGSCAGSSKKDGDKTAWIILPKGTCDKLVGGTTTENK